MRTLYAAEELLFTTVRIETEGAPSGPSCGTGFIFTYPESTAAEEGRDWLFLITNKHVVEGCTSFTFFLHGRDGDGPKIGDRRDVKMVPAGGPWWQGHPDPNVDIAVVDLGRAFNALSRAGPPPVHQGLV